MGRAGFGFKGEALTCSGASRLSETGLFEASRGAWVIEVPVSAGDAEHTGFRHCAENRPFTYGDRRDASSNGLHLQEVVAMNGSNPPRATRSHASGS